MYVETNRLAVNITINDPTKKKKREILITRFMDAR